MYITEYSVPDSTSIKYIFLRLVSTDTSIPTSVLSLSLPLISDILPCFGAGVMALPGITVPPVSEDAHPLPHTTTMAASISAAILLTVLS